MEKKETVKRNIFLYPLFIALTLTGVALYLLKVVDHIEFFIQPILSSFLEAL